MGEYADMAVDESLNGHWEYDYDTDESYAEFLGLYPQFRRNRRWLHGGPKPPAPLSDFKDLIQP